MTTRAMESSKDDVVGSFLLRRVDKEVIEICMIACS
jgi:hypothetical protein